MKHITEFQNSHLFLDEETGNVFKLKFKQIKKKNINNLSSNVCDFLIDVLRSRVFAEIESEEKRELNSHYINSIITYVSSTDDRELCRKLIGLSKDITFCNNILKSNRWASPEISDSSSDEESAGQVSANYTEDESVPREGTPCSEASTIDFNGDNSPPPSDTSQDGGVSPMLYSKRTPSCSDVCDEELEEEELPDISLPITRPSASFKGRDDGMKKGLLCIPNMASRSFDPSVPSTSGLRQRRSFPNMPSRDYTPNLTPMDTSVLTEKAITSSRCDSSDEIDEVD